MADLRELYQETILDHSRRPRNFQLLEDANRKAEGYNPLCGDRCKVFLKEHGGVIGKVTFQGAGCAIATASASLMTEVLKGKTVGEGTIVVSADGKTRTVTSTMTNAKGEKVTSTLAYDKS